MAQKSTIYKAELSVSDMDRHYYETHKAYGGEASFRNL